MPGSSPHTRGARGRPGRATRSGRIIPAYAGSTSTAAAIAFQTADHPRIRGEHQQTAHPSLRGQGSSPHTRGAPTSKSSNASPGRIIPAYAGSTRRRMRPWTSRGGSSPHTRGAHHDGNVVQRGDGIIPAYAGSTGLCNLGPGAEPDHPRIRGEHSVRAANFPYTVGSSPHTRGARLYGQALQVFRGIIPAYAGSTPVVVR